MEKKKDSPILRNEAGEDRQQDGNRGCVESIVNADSAEMTSLFECPVCYEVVVPPVTLCRSGHTVCKFCQEKLDKCPMCKGQFTKIPNLCAELFLEMRLVDCRFNESGCRMALPGKAISEHIKVCFYRPLRCNGCEQPIPYHKFLEHLKKDENLDMIDVPRCNTGFIVEDHDLRPLSERDLVPVWEPIWIHAYGQHFFCFLERSYDHWWIWVGAFGVQVEDCKKYIASVTVWSRGTEQVRDYVGPVHSIRASPQDLQNSGHCIYLQSDQLENLKSSDGIDIHLKIDMQ